METLMLVVLVLCMIAAGAIGVVALFMYTRAEDARRAAESALKRESEMREFYQRTSRENLEEVFFLRNAVRENQATIATLRTGLHAERERHSTFVRRAVQPSSC